jgi:hypothetical protein
VQCNNNYKLKGGKRIKDVDPNQIFGGTCEHIPGCPKALSGTSSSGAPAWGVALGVVLSLLTGTVAGVAACWVYDRRFRRTGPSHGLYQELALDNGF